MSLPETIQGDDDEDEGEYSSEEDSDEDEEESETSPVVEMKEAKPSRGRPEGRGVDG